jgi:lipopolysaccharide biosynthesis protein
VTAATGAGHSDLPTRPLVLAFFLPQFHPIPENDEWWGEGFTEWRNVAQARPRFPGHYQPHRPADLGYYDLRVPEVRERQAELARENGIDGFVWYHYWFSGRRLLQSPFEDVLATGQPNFPFAICWANEPWTRAWDGASGVTLMPQLYSPEDDVSHARWLARAMADPRYLRLAGRPIVLVYRATQLPDAPRTTDVWRQEIVRAGVAEPLIYRVQGPSGEEGDPTALGFDAAVEFQPYWTAFPRALRRTRLWFWSRRLRLTAPGYGQLKVFAYPELVDRVVSRPPVPWLRFPGVTPMWDNSPRRPNSGVVLVDSTPERYEAWLTVALREAMSIDGQGAVFINAWNEWGEGCHLEPDERHGRAYLEATRRAVTDSGASRLAAPRRWRLPGGEGLP